MMKMEEFQTMLRVSLEQALIHLPGPIHGIHALSG